MGEAVISVPRWRDLIQILYVKMDFVSGKELGDQLQVDPRTIRNDIKALHPILSASNNEITSVRGVGYKLVVRDETALRNLLLADVRERSNLHITPMLAEDRVDYIIRYLLLENRFVKLEDIADELYVSKSTINLIIPEVKKKLGEFQLTLDKKAGHGVKISGTELNIRFCFSHFLLGKSPSLLISETEQAFFDDVDLERIQQVVVDSVSTYAIHMTDIALKNLIIHIAIAVCRIRDDCYVAADELLNVEFNMQELRAAQTMIRGIEEQEGITFPETELSYLLLHLSAKHIAANEDDDREYMLVTKMLERIQKRYGYALMQDKALVSNLVLHLKPAINRIKFHMNIQNPYLPNLKQNYPLAFELGLTAKDVLEEELGAEVNEAEAGYLAIHLLYAMDKAEAGAKKRVLIVCASGLGTSQLLESKVRRAFAEQLDIIGVQSFYAYENEPRACDFVIATVPLRQKNHPYVQVSPFLTRADVRAIEGMLESEDEKVTLELENVFSEDLFLVSRANQTKNEILQDLALLLMQKGYVGEDYLSSIFEREQVVPTYLGNGLATPHPIQADVARTAIAVCICESPVLWNEEEKAQVVFMLAVKNKEQSQLATTYELISDIVEDPKTMRQLKEVRDFEGLIRILRRLSL
ncbi:BglG family transcription antiterminator [Listeria booriae]|uniref:Transcription antiterminator n=1 Tax=Listeria booriae TaxID=1552123 RepID=A0A7X0XRF6_9LIST|nr:BglG family transcription antiterminator [Listeria booriae]MBC1778897.1 transcription antiterminator [Listeria booriae]